MGDEAGFPPVDDPDLVGSYPALSRRTGMRLRMHERRGDPRSRSRSSCRRSTSTSRRPGRMCTSRNHA
ncbi:MAG: hypothetical protein AVDCRST_MAG30-1978 [uncultured Solirubrobacteraceae bacterium]|uniref:Uncharacterized protein n=1 Tax=uncultured Solirubrobacteraceae bacterium TaxID=1162706 RepID=A0A6J4SQE6_9ACTN|nr:MAG: hypothetical protein AVDCRST_MAG30-1978 [uncultured Solirubrobacteraceae bacterium]